MSAENAAKMAKAIYDIEINDAAYCEVEDIPLDDADTVRACLAGLKSSEWRAILGCAEALGKSRILHKEIITELRNLLKYEEDSVQTAAALSLCHLDVDDPNIVAAIIRLLHAKIKEETPYFCNANDLAENLGGLQRAAPVVVPAILKIRRMN